MKRTPKRLTPEQLIIRAVVFDRDVRCRLAGSLGTGPCFGTRMTPHHLRKAGQGGPYSIENLVTLCANHNDWVEDFRPAAWTWGLVIGHGETPEWAWRRMVMFGLVDYWWDGTSAGHHQPGLVA